MTKPSHFKYISYFPCSAEELYNYHARPGALERLLPPWENAHILSKEGSIAPGGKVLLKLRIGPFPFTWEAHHVEDEPGKMFRDVQHKGPFSFFSHTHTFTDTPKGARLEDNIEFRLPGHSMLPTPVIKQVMRKLKKNFRYREHVISEDILLHRRYSQTPLTILISGASGTLGQTLVPLLTTGGHQVYTLVRRTPAPDKNEIYWDPEKGEIDKDRLPQLDAVIHLAGEYIGLSRWSEEKKQRVLDSRTKGTALLAETLAALPTPPNVFLSASAVGYYGDRADQVLFEDTPSGTDYISKVCHAWEQASAPASSKGIRTVLMRLGVGLTPKGGALERLISASPLAYIRYFGRGDQYISWMSIDDMAAAMLHCIATQEITGPVNMAAPTPVTNKKLIETLSRVTARPRVHPLPAFLLRAAFGQMASEILLSSCRVDSTKLLNSGFQPRHQDLEYTLRQLLGKQLPATYEEKKI